MRPSTGRYDQKESLWLQRTSEWPSNDDVPNFRETTESFMSKCAGISDKVRMLVDQSMLWLMVDLIFPTFSDLLRNCSWVSRGSPPSRKRSNQIRLFDPTQAHPLPCIRECSRDLESRKPHRYRMSYSSVPARRRGRS